METSDIRSLILEDRPLREVEPGLFSVYGRNERPGTYDQAGKAAFYDRVMCNPVYNRIMWGYGVGEYHDLIRPVLDSPDKGWVLDAACGSLAFTETLYSSCRDRPVVLLDQSLDLLQKAKARLTQGREGLPPNLFLLHADALDLPFRPGSVAGLISLNLLHCLEDAAAAIREWGRVLVPGGNLAATTLIRGRFLGNLYLGALSRTEHMFSRDREELAGMLREAGLAAGISLKGNLALIRCRR